ncbi:MAG: hypothetical protein FWG50_01395 [Kiritimatiellaeota bacterium]|nr:hypothetical protein [Kiritimatiellota bacterium]
MGFRNAIGTGAATNFNCSHSLPITAWDIAKPLGDTVCWANSLLWEKEELTSYNHHFKILPESLDAEIYWSFDLGEFPAGPEMKITWDPWDVKNNRPHVGVGTNPKLKVTYENPQSKYADFMPPDNRWFGKKKITVQVGDATVTRPVWFFFLAPANRTIRQGGEMECAWFHYWKEGRVVPAFTDMGFEFDATLTVAAKYVWSPLWGTKYYVGRWSHSQIAMKPVFDVNVPGSYTEENYPNGEGKVGAHTLAKLCEHEWWHDRLDNEVRLPPFGLGRWDRDGDGLSNAREAELGTKINRKDTCGLANFDPTYSKYADYADQELFCRWKEITAPKGNPSKDWSSGGAQFPNPEN